MYIKNKKNEKEDKKLKAPRVLLQSVEEAQALQKIHVFWTRNWGSKWGSKDCATKECNPGNWAIRNLPKIDSLKPPMCGNKFTPIVKCVGFACNGACRYCFYNNDNRKLRLIPMEILNTLIKTVCKINPGIVRFYWHGGEPLLAGISFYKKILRIEERYKLPNQKIYNLIQTNATLLNQKWISFMKENKFGVSISLDGPREIHNRYRRLKNGDGMFNSVMQGVSLLKKAEIPFGTVCVITADSVGEPEKIFQFFLEEKISNVNFIPAEGLDKAGNPLPFVPKPQKFIQFLKKIFQIWIKEDNPNLKISQIDRIIQAIINEDGGTDCIYAAKCDQFLDVAPNGDLYACHSQCNKDKWRLGNILHLELNSQKFESLRNMMKELRAECQGCEWEKSCRGGCFCDYNLDYPEEEKRNLMCPKALFREIHDVLQDYSLLNGKSTISAPSILNYTSPSN